MMYMMTTARTDGGGSSIRGMHVRGKYAYITIFKLYSVSTYRWLRFYPLHGIGESVVWGFMILSIYMTYFQNNPSRSIQVRRYDFPDDDG